MNPLKRIALALVIIGAINWGLIGFFQFDLVASIFGGQHAALSRIVYGLVGLSGLYCLTILFDPMEEKSTNRDDLGKKGRLNYGTEFGEETDLSGVRKHDRDL
ncbi:DUF378 domain-containing protein [Oceanobacillus arenosus]|uniref:DUF378 domain-containing protein n=1 Tax=Oceanobacillus arenosus TaxID=1229153 RepID=A0A3D8PSQ1_9BACI|nr:DUF378 domain-containing protein [Oceanobacillus arenosus]RDW18268.1 DUF378 domain-containing protein [Oceanobacillus arenosus]